MFRIAYGRAIATGVMVGAFAMADHGWSQSRRVMMVNDGGDGPVIRHFSMPDMGQIRQPDFILRDIPIFQEKLVLSDAQVASFERQIQIYLETLAALAKDMLVVPEGGPVIRMSGPRPEGLAEGEPIVIAPPNLDELPQFNLSDLDLPPGSVNMEVGVRIGGPDGDDADDGAPGVFVNLRPSDDEDLPEEVRQELEKRAAEMAEKIREQVTKAMAEQAAAGEGGGAGAALPGMRDIEDFERQQQDMEASAAKFRKAKIELRREFVAEAHAKLAEDQVERWPALERALLRERSLPNGRLSGERTDLFKHTKSLNLDSTESAAIASLLDSYDVELDAALRQRDDVVQDVNAKLNKAMEQQEFDRALSAVDRAGAARVAVRSLNERYVEAIAEKLSPTSAQTLRENVLKNAYPQVYRPTLADRSFAAAQKLDDLSPDARTALQQLEQAYQLERQELNLRMRRAIDKHEPLEPRIPIEHMRAIHASGEAGAFVDLHEQNPVREVSAKRRELDDRYIRSLHAVLTPEQVVKLPKRGAVSAEGQPVIFRRTRSD